MPKAMIPPTQPVAISLYSLTIPMQDSIPKTMIAKNICGLTLPIIPSPYIGATGVP